MPLQLVLSNIGPLGNLCFQSLSAVAPNKFHMFILVNFGLYFVLKTLEVKKDTYGVGFFIPTSNEDSVGRLILLMALNPAFASHSLYSCSLYEAPPIVPSSI